MNNPQEYYPEIERLRQVLNQPLPGKAIQFEMAPSYRPEMDESGPRIKAGVMILLYPQAEKWHFPLIVRPEYNGAHSGQISFPGGKYDTDDLDLVQTALRECEEEIGVKVHRIEIIGKLSTLYIPVSKFEVYPIVGVLNHQPVFHPDPEEVKSILEVSLDMIFDETNLMSKEVEFRQRQETVPYFNFSGAMVWGATAMILSEFRHLWKKANLGQSTRFL